MYYSTRKHTVISTAVCSD